MVSKNSVLYRINITIIINLINLYVEGSLGPYITHIIVEFLWKNIFQVPRPDFLTFDPE